LLRGCWRGLDWRGGKGRGNVKAQLWRAVLKNLVTRDNLEGLDLAAVAGEMKEEFDPTKEGIEDVEMLDFEALPERKDEWESEGFGGYGDSDDDTLLWDDEDRERVDVNFCDEWSSDDGLISSDGEDELWAAPETGDDEIWEALEKTKEDSDEDVFESYEWEEMMKGMAW
jgi:hypothetical protein